MIRMIIASLALLSVAAYSQAASPSAADGEPAAGAAPVQSAPAVDEQHLKRFAAAYLAVEAIRESFQARMEQTETVRARDELALEANRRMAETIAARGLTVEGYNAIARASHVDETLRDRLLDELARLTAAGSSGGS